MNQARKQEINQSEKINNIVSLYQSIAILNLVQFLNLINKTLSKIIERKKHWYLYS